MTARELREKKEEDGAFLNKDSNSLLYKPVVLRLKIKQGIRDGQREIRTNIQAIRCTRVADEAAYTAEIDKLAEFINDSGVVSAADTQPTDHPVTLNRDETEAPESQA